MTEKQCADKACEMLRHYITVKRLREAIQKIKESGIEDFSKYPNNYTLPRIILAGFLKSNADTFYTSKDCKKVFQVEKYL